MWGRNIGRELVKAEEAGCMISFAELASSLAFVILDLSIVFPLAFTSFVDY